MKIGTTTLLLLLLLVAFASLTGAVESEGATGSSQSKKKGKKSKKSKDSSKVQEDLGSANGGVDPVDKKAAAAGAGKCAQPDFVAPPFLAPKALTRLRQRWKSVQTRNEKKCKQRLERASRRKEKRAQRYLRLDKKYQEALDAELPATIAAGVKKLEWLRNRTAESKFHVARASYGVLKSHVMTGPRPYWTVLHFTANAKMGCMLCDRMKNVTRSLAKAYFEQNQGQAISDSGHGGSESPVYFVESALNKMSQEDLRELYITRAPIVALIPPRAFSGGPKPSGFLKAIPSKYLFPLSSSEFDALEINDFIKKHTKAEVLLTKDAFSISRTEIAIAAALLVGLLGSVYLFGPRLLGFARAQWGFFFVAGSLFYLFGISGGMYNILRDVPFVSGSYNITGNYTNSEKFFDSFLGHGSREQYGAEGFLVGACVGLCGLALVLLERTAAAPATPKQIKGPNYGCVYGLYKRLCCWKSRKPKTDDDTETTSTQPDEEEKEKPPKRLVFRIFGAVYWSCPIQRLLIGLLVQGALILAVWYLYYQVLALYSYKNRWYNMGRVEGSEWIFALPNKWRVRGVNYLSSKGVPKKEMLKWLSKFDAQWGRLQKLIANAKPLQHIAKAIFKVREELLWLYDQYLLPLVERTSWGAASANPEGKFL